jgi:hypothetical protein
MSVRAVARSSVALQLCWWRISRWSCATGAAPLGWWRSTGPLCSVSLRALLLPRRRSRLRRRQQVRRDGRRRGPRLSARRRHAPLHFLRHSRVEALGGEAAAIRECCPLWSRPPSPKTYARGRGGDAAIAVAERPRRKARRGDAQESGGRSIRPGPIPTPHFRVANEPSYDCFKSCAAQNPKLSQGSQTRD